MKIYSTICLTLLSCLGTYSQAQEYVEPGSLVAPKIADWQEMVWLDENGKPKEFMSGSYVELGDKSKKNTDTLPTYKINFAQSVSCGEFLLLEKANWYLSGEGVSLIGGEGPIADFGKLNVGINMYMRYFKATKGNEFMVNAHGSLNGQNLSLEGGSAYFAGGRADVYHVFMDQAALLKCTGNSLVEFVTMDMSEDSTLQVAGTTITPHKGGTQIAFWQIHPNEQEHKAAIVGNAIQSALIPKVKINIGKKGGEFSGVCIEDSVITMEEAGAMLHLDGVVLKNASLTAAANTSCDLYLVTVDSEVSGTERVTPKKLGEEVTALMIDQLKISKDSKSSVSGPLSIYIRHNAAVGELILQHLENNMTVPVVLKGVPVTALNVGHYDIKIMMPAADADRAEIEVVGIDSTPDGDVVLLLDREMTIIGEKQ